MRRVLLRCDSTGDLYPVTSPSPIPHAFLVRQHTWHQRLGYPGGEVMRRLVSSNFISCNKEKPPVLCHACQLGKQVKLPFVSSLFSVLNIIGYRCLDLHTNKIIISRHVTFDETVFPYGSTIPKSTSPYTFLEDTFDLHLTLPNPAFTTPTIGQTDPLPHQQHPTKPAAQQSPTVAPPTPTSPSTAQIHSPVQQPSPMAQHTPIQLQFSPTTISHQTIIVSDQHAPAIIQNPPVNPYPDSVHPMVTRFHVRTNRPTKRLNLHVSFVSPLPKSYRDAFNDPNWQNAMRDEYTARYKVRLVANGSTHLEGVDVDETFSLVVKPGTILAILSLAASRHWPIHQLDVKNAFLYGDLSETVYMHQPPRFRDSAHPDYVCLLQRRCDSSLFIYKQGIDTAYLLLYVDDIVLTASSEGLLQQIIGSFHQEFAMTDLGPLNYFLVQQVCLHMHDPREPHLSALKSILRYVQGTMNYGLQLFSSSTIDLVAYSDADWAGCPTTRRSTSGYCVFLGNNLLSWFAKRQPKLSRSSAEAEYRGVSNAVAETCWLRNLIRKLHTPLSSATLVYCGNVSAVYLSSNPIQHQRTKHIEIDIHFVHDLVAACQVRVLHVPSHYQFADIFTKGLPSALFKEFRASLSVRCPPAPTVGEC
ncbi:ribonuclease H-like domain-containing protein [Tanacetum coccineum]